MSILALTVPAPPGPVVARDPQRGQIPSRAIGHHDHIPTTPAVAAVGATARNMRLAPEADDAVAAGAALHVDSRPILEHRLRIAGRLIPDPYATRASRERISEARPVGLSSRSSQVTGSARQPAAVSALSRTRSR